MRLNRLGIENVRIGEIEIFLQLFLCKAEQTEQEEKFSK